MRESMILLLVAAVASVFAWSFWHLAAGHGIDILTTTMLLLLAVDNLRLRRRLKYQEAVKDVPPADSALR